MNKKNFAFKLKLNFTVFKCRLSFRTHCTLFYLPGTGFSFPTIDVDELEISEDPPSLSYFMTKLENIPRYIFSLLKW